MATCGGVLARPNVWLGPVILVVVMVLTGFLTWLGMPVAGIVAVIGAASLAAQRATVHSVSRSSMP